MYIFVIIVIIAVASFFLIKGVKKETVPENNNVLVVDNFGDNKNIGISDVFIKSVVDVWQTTTITFHGVSTSEKEESVRLNVKLYGGGTTDSTKTFIAEKNFDYTFTTIGEDVTITFPRQRPFYDAVRVEIEGGKTIVSATTSVIVETLEQ